jgi:DNA-binding MarR family transcriptional regulator
MNQTQSALRLSTERAHESLEPPRNTNHTPGRTDGPAAPMVTSEAAASPPPHSLRLHAPPADRQADPPSTSSGADRAAEEIVDGVLKAAHRLRGLLSGHFSEFDLTDVRFSVLRFLRDAEPHGCTQSEIAEHLDQSESSISTLVKRMRKSELLYRLRSGIDKRKWVLKLTSRGSSLLDTARRCHAERMDGFLRAFDSEERLNLTGMLSKLVAELTPQDVPPTPIVETPTAGEPAAPANGAPILPEADAPIASADVATNSTAGEAPAA